MNRDDFQRLANIRVKEARTLLDAAHYPGAYYLIGYAVECALKACVSKQIKRYDFPDKKIIIDAHSHELEKLVGIAGLATDFKQDRQNNRNLEVNWAVVKIGKKLLDMTLASQDNRGLIYILPSKDETAYSNGLKKRW